MLMLICIWTAAAFLAWLFVYGAGRATEPDSVGRAKHDSEIENQGEIPAIHRKQGKDAHMSLSKIDSIPEGHVPEGATEATYYLYVDYDLLHKVGQNRFFGNWRNTAEEACRDKNVNRYVDRSQMRNYEFAQACPGSREGIWKFTLA